MIILKYIKKSFLNPEKTGYSYSLLRTFLKKPIIFDLVSLILQWANLKRQDRVLNNNQESDEHYKEVFAYNASITDRNKISTTRRPEEYFRILESCSKDRENKKLLLIGPRDVFELYIAWLYGFSWDNIHAIDLYSAHPKIKVMNMEDMTFDDESFDYVLLSRVYAYSKKPRDFISGISRILKTGGKVVLEANYVPNDEAWKTNHIKGSETINYLVDANLNISYYKYHEKTNALNLRQACHTIAATKLGSLSDIFDPIIFTPSRGESESGVLAEKNSFADSPH